MTEWEPPGHGDHDKNCYGDRDVRWWCDRCGTSCLETTTCDCCELAELRDQVQAVRDACNSSTEIMSWRPPRGERGIHFPVVRVERILATLDW